MSEFDLGELAPEPGDAGEFRVRFQATPTSEYDYWGHDGVWVRDQSKARVFTSRRIAVLHMKRAQHQGARGSRPAGRRVELEVIE